jgi:UDP-glucose 4-epimerase
MRVLITGGAGFIGHHLVHAVLARGDEVTVLDDLSNGSVARLSDVAGEIAFVHGSVVDEAAVREAMRDVEVVFHLAAIASVAQSWQAPRRTDEVNVGGTIEVALAAAAHGVRRVVFAGSSAVYGNPARLPCREQQRPDPQSPYGAGKLAAEHYLHALGQELGVETAVLRYFNVFGPGQDPASEYSAVVPRFITAVLAGRRPTIYGSGEISRDFIHVDNVVAANLLAAAADAPSGLTCNIASGLRTSLLELLAAIGQATGRSVEPIFGPPRAGDVLHSQGDISLAKRVLGYRVRAPFAEGIADTVRWYQGQPVSSAND